jgi:hypothetical protein
MHLETPMVKSGPGGEKTSPECSKICTWEVAAELILHNEHIRATSSDILSTR